MQYLDFELEIDGGPGAYQVIARSPEGQAREQASMTVTAEQLAASASSGGSVRASARAIGQRLFEGVFAGTVRDLYSRTRVSARLKKMGVRIRLSVIPPALAGFPWELLYDPGEDDHLALDRDTPLVRSLPALQPVEPLAAPTPLQMLAMAAATGSLQPSDVMRHRQQLEGWLKPLVDSRQIELAWAEPNWDDLQRKLQERERHIFYFFGHGGFDEDEQEGFIQMEDGHGEAEPIYAKPLGSLLSNQRELRLVHLVACEGAFSSPTDVFSSTAATLIRRGLPAVLAMQREISLEAASRLTPVFYSALANGLPIDAAVVEARVAVRRFPNSADWAIPALFMRAEDGVLFRQPERKTATQAPSAVSATPASTPVTVDPTSPLGKLRAIASQPAASVSRPELRRAMAAALSFADLDTLCDDITGRLRGSGMPQAVSVDIVGRGGLELTILNLIQYLDRRGLLQVLLDVLRE